MASSSDDLVIGFECRAGSGKCGIFSEEHARKRRDSKSIGVWANGSNHVQGPTLEQLMVVNSNNKAWFYPSKGLNELFYGSSLRPSQKPLRPSHQALNLKH
jgi:hypothetical protein